MKRNIIGGLAVSALLIASTFSIASAADMALKAPPPPALISSWSGCYVGANIGGGWAHKDFSLENGAAIVDEGSHTANGVAGGGQVGCDYQLAPNLLIGIQGMFDGANLTGSNKVTDDDDGSFYTRVHWFGTIAGRLGYLVNPSLLIYGKGGVAFVGENQWRGDVEGVSRVFVEATTGNFTRTGWDAGIGAEWMFAPHWAAFLEYDHMGFGNRTETFTYADGTFFQESVKQSVDKILFGINYHFALAQK